MNNIKLFFQKIRPEIKYILLLFVATRLILTIIGFSSQAILYPYHGEYNVWHYSDNKFLNTWGIWDTGWYLATASQWYPEIEDPATIRTQESNWAFFPLYPALIRMLEHVVGDFFISSLIISNLSLLIACWFLYKLVKIDYGGETALRSVKYMLVYPVAFIFSGGFTESLFIALLLSSFYFAKTNKWYAVGITGFFLTLTRSLGVFALIPLFYIYIKNNSQILILQKDNLKQTLRFSNLLNYIKSIKLQPNILWLGLIPLALFLWMGYNYYMTSDYLAFAHIQEAWERQYANPLLVLFKGLINPHLHIFISAISGLSVILLINIYIKKIGFTYWLLGMYSIFIPLSTGIFSLPRFTLTVFPVFIIFALIGKNKVLDDILVITLVLLQGFFMVFWSDGFGLIV